MWDTIQKLEYRAKANIIQAKAVLDCSESSARRVLTNLVDKGYLSVDSSQRTYVYRLDQHIPNV